MIQVYSSDVTVDANGVFPLNSVRVNKGSYAELVGSAIQLNKCGVYMVEVDASLTPAAAGTVAIQMYKDGVAQPQAYNYFTGVAETANTASFMAFVQVPQNNSPCCCSSPTFLTINNESEEEVTGRINVCVSKIC